MADLLNSGAAYLSSQLQSAASETVTYTQGNTAATLKATFGSQLLRVTDHQGRVKTERTARDFIFALAAMTAAGLTLPQRGDKVTISTGEVFEVTPYDSEAAWRYSDPFETLVRVHTKQVQ